MRPEFRSTRSARVIPSTISNNTSKKAQSTRPVSLPPAVHSSSHAVLDPLDPSWKKQGRHRMTDEQLLRLDALYDKKTHPTTQEKHALGKEVGLEVKTVAVWFQNKRQTEKKAGRLSSTSSLSSSSEQSGLKRVSSPSRNTTLGKRTRPPHYTDKYPPAASRRKPRLSADDPQSTSATSYQADCDTYSPHVRHTEPQIYRPMEVSDHTIIPAQELWKYLLSSPPGESLQASSSDVDSREPSENIPAVDNQGSTIDGGSRRSRMLEWVCDRQTKKRRNNRGGSGDPATLMATEGTDETCRNCFHRPDFDTAISLLTLPGDAGPSEDVIRGASLLLCFKNSAPKMRKVDQV